MHQKAPLKVRIISLGDFRTPGTSCGESAAARSPTGLETSKSWHPGAPAGGPGGRTPPDQVLTGPARYDIVTQRRTSGSFWLPVYPGETPPPGRRKAG